MHNTYIISDNLQHHAHVSFSNQPKNKSCRWISIQFSLSPFVITYMIILSENELKKFKSMKYTEIVSQIHHMFDCPETTNINININIKSTQLNSKYTTSLQKRTNKQTKSIYTSLPLANLYRKLLLHLLVAKSNIVNIHILYTYT